MYKFYVFSIFCTICLSCATVADNGDNTTTISSNWPQIYHSNSKSWVSMEHIKKEMAVSQIVFVGEKHDHQWGHKVELDLLEAFWQVHGSNIAVALEMFERDVQHLLTGYLQEQITEEFFLANSRPWKNYQTDYKPLIEFAKRAQFSVLAANVPRRYASYAAKGKEEILQKLPDYEKNFMAKEIVAPKGKYYEKFYKTMAGHVPPEAIDRYYKAQCLKDDTMAKSIHELMASQTSVRVISYTGSFHCDEDLGLPEKIMAKMPGVSILSITIIPVDGQVKNPQEYHHLADFVIFAPKNKTK